MVCPVSAFSPQCKKWKYTLCYLLWIGVCSVKRVYQEIKLSKAINYVVWTNWLIQLIKNGLGHDRWKAVHCNWVRKPSPLILPLALTLRFCNSGIGSWPMIFIPYSQESMLLFYLKINRENCSLLYIYIFLNLFGNKILCTCKHSNFYHLC